MDKNKLINEILEYAVQEYFDNKPIKQIVNEIKELKILELIKERKSNGNKRAICNR